MLLHNQQKDTNQWQEDHNPDHKSTEIRNKKDPEDNIELEWAQFQKYKFGLRNKSSNQSINRLTFGQGFSILKKNLLTFILQFTAVFSIQGTSLSNYKTSSG